MTTEDILQTRYEFSIVLVKGELSRGLSCQEIVFTAKEHVVNHNNMICTFNKKLVDEMTADEPCSPVTRKVLPAIWRSWLMIRPPIAGSDRRSSWRLSQPAHLETPGNTRRGNWR